MLALFVGQRMSKQDTDHTTLSLHTHQMDRLMGNGEWRNVTTVVGRDISQVTLCGGGCYFVVSHVWHLMEMRSILELHTHSVVNPITPN